MANNKQNITQDVRPACLLRAFADINCDFADWYQATQLEIDKLEKELAEDLQPVHS
ncbi:hypothetical protein [Candidatus Avelusimicrobium luingense]|uniref:hypothetical protein n=1 Tax=Candidatus Avelusimicrobium luingense TaxID=3416211 RepID=UPI003D11864A